MSLRILHTADLHLGSSFRGLGKLGKQLRKAQCKTLSNIINLAKEYSVDCNRFDAFLMHHVLSSL